MTAEFGGVAPLEDLRPDLLRDKEAVRGACAWIGVVTLGSPHCQLDLPSCGSDDLGQGHNETRRRGASVT